MGIVQTNLNIVHMNKDIVDMSKELMKINWTHGFNLKEEKRFLTKTLKNTDSLNEINRNNNLENNKNVEIHSDVVKMNKDIVQMNKDIVEINKSITSDRRNSNYKKVKIFNKITKTETLDNTEKENRDPKRENKEQNVILQQQKKSVKE